MHSLKSVLVVDDDPSLRGLLVRALRQHGFNVAAAASAEEGLRLAAGKSFDAVMLDNDLPGAKGIAALPEFLRSRGHLVIMMADAPSEELAAQALRQGARSVLSKPFNVLSAAEDVQRLIG
jgi:DNA-binding response OmpR family regulator